MDQNLQGKVALVTGATSGLGLEASAGLAARGMKIIFAVRNAKKAQKVAQEICDKVPQAKLLYPPEVPTVDFQDNDSIRAYAKAILERGEPLAVLINNAGTSKLPNEPTKDGVASLAQANYLGPWLLTHLLEPLLVSSKTRVVFVSSMTARSCVINDPHTFLTSWWHSWYKHTKLAGCVNAFELQRRLGSQGVTVTALDPGGVNTAIWTNTVFSTFPIKQVIEEVYAPADEAAEIIIHAATVPWEVDAEPGVPPEEDLRFYARGLCASPLVCNIDGSWSTWFSTPKWSMWGASAIMHTLLDYPLRHRSGRRLCARIQRVPGPHQAYDRNLAKQLWSLSEKFTGTTSTPLAAPQQLPQEAAAPMSKGKAGGTSRQDMEPSTATAGTEVAGDAVAEVRALPVSAAASKAASKPELQGVGEGEGGMGQGMGGDSATSGAAAVQVAPTGPETRPETATTSTTNVPATTPEKLSKAKPPHEGGGPAAEGDEANVPPHQGEQAAPVSETAKASESGPDRGTADQSAAREIQPEVVEALSPATVAEPAQATAAATAVDTAVRDATAATGAEEAASTGTGTVPPPAKPETDSGTAAKSGSAGTTAPPAKPEKDSGTAAKPGSAGTVPESDMGMLEEAIEAVESLPHPGQSAAALAEQLAQSEGKGVAGAGTNATRAPYTIMHQGSGGAASAGAIPGRTGKQASGGGSMAAPAVSQQQQPSGGITPTGGAAGAGVKGETEAKGGVKPPTAASVGDTGVGSSTAAKDVKDMGTKAAGQPPAAAVQPAAAATAAPAGAGAPSTGSGVKPAASGGAGGSSKKKGKGRRK